MSVRIDASGDKLSRTTNLPTNAAYTVAMWWYYVSAPGVGAYFLSVENAATSGTAYHLLGFNAAGSFRIVVNGGSTNFGADPATGAWHFIAMKSDGVNIKAYHRTLAGVWQTATHAATTFTNAAIILGANSYNEWVSCRIAVAKVWDAVLTDADIEQEALSILPRRFTSLNSFSPCFPGSGERAKDYSGNGRNWTEGGTLTDEDPPPISWGTGSLWLPFTPTVAAATSLPPMRPPPMYLLAR